MGGFDFDRQPFTRPAAPEPKPQQPSVIPGSLILLVVLVGGGFAAYRFLNISGGAQVPKNDAALQQVEKRLDTLEHRMDQMERRRRAFLARPPIPAAEDEPTYGVSRTPARHSVSISGSAPLQDSRPTRSAPAALESVVVGQAKPSLGKSAGNKGVSPRAVGQSSQQEWEATANRLGDVVGELATQRNEIDQTQERLGRLSQRLGQTITRFTLERGARPERVGPVRLQLEHVDARKQHYTMRLLMGDQSIELKNRALNEAIQFYMPGGAVSFELVVSQIRKDSVTGGLSLPVRPLARSGAMKFPSKP